MFVEIMMAHKNDHENDITRHYQGRWPAATALQHARFLDVYSHVVGGSGTLLHSEMEVKTCHFWEDSDFKIQFSDLISTTHSRAGSLSTFYDTSAHTLS